MNTFEKIIIVNYIFDKAATVVVRYDDKLLFPTPVQE